MKNQIILEIDTTMARELEEIAPSRKRQRSEFLRQALRKALDEAAEAKMREAYTRCPDDIDPYTIDPAAWEGRGAPRRRRQTRK